MRRSRRKCQLIALFEKPRTAVHHDPHRALKADEALRLHRVDVLWGQPSASLIRRLHDEQLCRELEKRHGLTSDRMSERCADVESFGPQLHGHVLLLCDHPLLRTGALRRCRLSDA
jgi:hypothetical protein